VEGESEAVTLALSLSVAAVEAEREGEGDSVSVGDTVGVNEGLSVAEGVGSTHTPFAQKPGTNTDTMFTLQLLPSVASTREELLCVGSHVLQPST